MNFAIEEYVNDLYNKENDGADLLQYGLFTKKDYYELLLPIVNLIRENSDLSIEEMRQILYEKSGIENSLKDFIYKKEMVPGMVCTYGTKNYRETLVIGNRQEVSIDSNGKLVPDVEEMTDDTIFDLASVTKVFTSLSILKLVQEGVISLDDKITKYEPRFSKLGDTTIYELLSFGVQLKTDGRVDRTQSREEAEQILFSLYVDREYQKENPYARPYTDMGAMALKYVIENASGMNYYKYVDENVLKPIKMVDTHVAIPKSKLYRTANANFEGRYYKDGNVLTNMSAPKGIVNDPKAEILGQKNGVLSGHAGMFSTAKDMSNLAKSFINNDILSDEYVYELAKNRTGKGFFSDNKTKYVQFHGYLCYSKNPILADSELFHAMSGRSFASAGFTGTQLTVDPLNELYLFMASNRTHNRMVFIDPSKNNEVKENENGKKTILLPNGEERIDSRRFAWDRDSAIIHPALKLTLQYKMLEDMLNYTNEKEEENVKRI